MLMGKRELKLIEAVQMNLLFKVRCSTCRKTTYFVAADLVTVRNLVMPISTLPFVCRECRSAEWVNFDTYMPRPEDIGRLRVQRKVNGTWREEPLEGRVVRR